MGRRTRDIFIEVLLASTFVVLLGAIAYFVSEQQGSEYRTSVFWSLSTPAADAGVDMEAFATAATSDQVLAAALSASGSNLGLSDVSALRDAVTVSVDADADAPVLRLRARGSTADRAMARADAVASALASWDASTGPDRIDAALDTYDDRIEALQRRIRVLQVVESEAGDTTLEELLADREEFVSRRNELSASGAAGTVSLLERTDTDTRRIAPNTARNVALAAGIGLILSIALGARLPRSRGRRAKRATHLSDVQVLTSFPYGAVDDDWLLQGPAARLRQHIEAVTSARENRTILLTSPGEGEGNTTVACALAEAFARAGRTTLLVDGDLGAPSLAERYGLTEEAGEATTMLEWLQNPQGPARVVSVSLDDDTHLDLVPQIRATRFAPGAAGSLLSGFHEAEQRWRVYDAVIIDASPVLTARETRVFARSATCALLVTNRGSDGDGRTRAAVEMLQEVGARLLGLVENDPVGGADDSLEAWTAPPQRGARNPRGRSSAVVDLERSGR